MRRIEMQELHDHPRFPESLRNLVTDALEALWEFGNSYKPILPMLYAAVAGSAPPSADPDNASPSKASPDNALEVVDLCSGGGGPWLRLEREFEQAYGVSLRVCLTDKYPNKAAFDRAQRSSSHAVRYVPTPVDALSVPAELTGFRTIFSSFHHFGPEDARSILRDAARSGCGIGVFEVARRDPGTLLVLCVTPPLVLWLTLWMRPLRWSRIFWTYVLPVVPFTIWFDGLVSCLRAYGLNELREMVADAPDRWVIGEARTGLLPVTYLFGRTTDALRKSRIGIPS